MSTLPEITYTPESVLRRPVLLLKSMCAELAASRELAYRLFIRNFSARYRQSILGYLWALLPPLVNASIWIFLQSQSIINVGETAIPYPIFVFTGTILWQCFVESLQCPLKNVLLEKSIVIKINFPKEAVILSGIAEVVLNMFIRLAMLGIIFLWFRVTIPPTIILAPIAVAALIILGISAGLLLVPIGILYNDVMSGINIVVRFWFFLTPVIYPPPSSWPASLTASLNPVSPPLVMARDLITVGKLSHLPTTMIIVAVSILMLITGWVLFRISLPHLIQRLGD